MAEDIAIGLEVCMPATKDVSMLIVDLPRGAWVALSHDEERVVAYAAELPEAIRRAKELGEADPIVIRIPEATSTTMFF